MTLLQNVPVPSRPPAALQTVSGAARYTDLLDGAARFRDQLDGRTIWNVNSTAVGGGVAEMLHVLVGYVAELGIAIRWMVISGDPAFFATTKRLHNQLHGVLGQGELGDAEAHHYEEILAGNAAELLPGHPRRHRHPARPADRWPHRSPGQSRGEGGLALPHRRRRAERHVACGVGLPAPVPGAGPRLRLHQAPVRAAVGAAAQDGTIPPSIDPFSPKNVHLDDGAVAAILGAIGVAEATGAAERGRFTRDDGTVAEVIPPAMVTGDGRPGPRDRVVAQVSRWDKLKDMAGVMTGFARYVASEPGTYLILAGPSVSGVADDPEGATVFADCLARWQELPAETRDRVLLVSLPMDDVEENAAMVNAIQRRATVIVQKSLAEGFGLTVAEGMWKGRPVVGSAVGGIADQIAGGTGVLLNDPADLAAFGKEVRWLLAHPDTADQMGAAAHTFIRENYLGDIRLLRYAQLFSSLLGAAQA